MRTRSTPGRAFVGAVAGLSLAAFAAGASVCRAGAVATYYAETFQSLNDSGVHGTALVSLYKDTLTVQIKATGLEPGKFHPQHLHAVLNPNSTPSRVPMVPRDDKNHNGMIDDIEGDATMGSEAVYLTKNPDTMTQNIFSDYPVASAKGTEYFIQSYDVKEQLPFLLPLSIRGVELHGMTEMGKYVPDMPVAAGVLHQIAAPGSQTSGSGSKLTTAAAAGSGLGGGAQSVPLPPSAWTGLATLAGLGLFAARRWAASARPRVTERGQAEATRFWRGRLIRPRLLCRRGRPTHVYRLNGLIRFRKMTCAARVPLSLSLSPEVTTPAGPSRADYFPYAYYSSDTDFLDAVAIVSPAALAV